jgi:NACHT domain
MSLSTGSQHLVVGVPDAGKSALLRTVVLDVFADTPRFVGQVDRLHGMLPIWLPFAFWTNAARRNANSVSVLDAIRDWLCAYDHGHLRPLIERALRDERALLVVDGLDEWASPDLARMCIDRLEVFASTKGASVIASSRPFSTADLPVDDSRWRLGILAPLDHQQRLSFVSKWLAPLVAEPALAKEAAEWTSEIGSSGHLRELADLPLFLLLLLRIREQQTEFPEDLYAVLSDAITRLIGEHRRRKIDTSGAADLFPPSGDIRKISAATTEHMHTSSMIAISDDELREEFRRALAESIGYPAAEAHARAIALVNSLSPGVGLMVRPAPPDQLLPPLGP